MGENESILHCIATGAILLTITRANSSTMPGAHAMAPASDGAMVASTANR